MQMKKYFSIILIFCLSNCMGQYPNLQVDEYGRVSGLKRDTTMPIRYFSTDIVGGKIRMIICYTTNPPSYDTSWTEVDTLRSEPRGYGNTLEIKNANPIIINSRDIHTGEIILHTSIWQLKKVDSSAYYLQKYKQFMARYTNSIGYKQVQEMSDSCRKYYELLNRGK